MESVQQNGGQNDNERKKETMHQRERKKVRERERIWRVENWQSSMVPSLR